jgi:NADPH:quinone reductase-like Zn-dependent oxidoreductase
MKAYVLKKYSEKEELQQLEMPEPALKENEVLVRIHAAGLNQLDLKLKSGAFKMIMPYRLPLILGHDVAGVVIKTAAGSTLFKVGDEVFGRVEDFKIGTFAEYIAVNEHDLALKPGNISFEQAASVPLVALTAWQAFEKAKLQKGQKVFIQAGSGGVGTLAIQLAKHLGATVATTTSAANFDLVKKLGADILIDYKTADFEDTLRDYDLVLNSQDASTLLKSIKTLKKGGKAVSISGPPDVAFAKDAGLNWLMQTVISLLGRKVLKQATKLEVDYSFLFMKASGRQLAEIGKLIQAGVIQPVVDKVFPFSQVNEAMSYVGSGRVRGKVVVKVR